MIWVLLKNLDMLFHNLKMMLIILVEILKMLKCILLNYNKPYKQIWMVKLWLMNVKKKNKKVKNLKVQKVLKIQTVLKVVKVVKIWCKWNNNKCKIKKWCNKTWWWKILNKLKQTLMQILNLIYGIQVDQLCMDQMFLVMQYFKIIVL